MLRTTSPIRSNTQGTLLHELCPFAIYRISKSPVNMLLQKNVCPVIVLPRISPSPTTPFHQPTDFRIIFVCAFKMFILYYKLLKLLFI